MRLGSLAGHYDIQLRGILIAPFQVLPDRAGKKHVLLQNNSHRVTDVFQCIVPYVMSANLYRPFRGIIQPRYQLNERGLTGTGSSDNSDH